MGMEWREGREGEERQREGKPGKGTVRGPLLYAVRSCTHTRAHSQKNIKKC